MLYYREVGSVIAIEWVITFRQARAVRGRGVIDSLGTP